VTEDQQSSGHSIEIYVNNQLVHTLHSGEGQQILDLASWLKPGSNTVRINSNSVSASGGTLYVYIGSGSNQSGTVVLDRPEIQYGLGASRQGPYGHDYTLTVN
jgi:hypothetical protein